MPFADLSGWLDQLAALEGLSKGRTVYQGHGPAPAPPSAIAEQRRFLQTVQRWTGDAIRDGELSVEELQQIVFELEAEWPFHTGVAGNTRREMLAFAVERAAEQQGRTASGVIRLIRLSPCV